MCSPITDGAAAVILASEERARDLTDRPVWIRGTGQALDGFQLTSLHEDYAHWPALEASNTRTRRATLEICEWTGANVQLVDRPVEMLTRYRSAWLYVDGQPITWWPPSVGGLGDRSSGAPSPRRSRRRSHFESWSIGVQSHTMTTASRTATITASTGAERAP